MADAWTSVVETEPEWDDNTRGLVEGLALYDLHVHRCGLHSSILEDPETYRFTFEVDDCAVCAAMAAKHRVLADEDAAWLKAHPEAKPKDRRPADGRSVRLRPMTPNESDKADQAKQERAKGAGRGRSPGKRQGRR